ncbi:MAG: hypothetical protein ACI86M_002156, partial [Saprospiraceae bacterium]
KLKFRKPILTPNGIPNLFGIKKVLRSIAI